MRWQNEDITEVDEGGGVGDHAREAGLTAAVERAEAEGVLDRAPDEIARDLPRPVRLLAELAMNHSSVESRLLCTDRVHEASMRQFVDRNLLRRAHDAAVAYLESVPRRPVGPRATREELLAQLGVPLSRSGESAEAVIDALVRAAERGVTTSSSPRYFGFVIGGSMPVSVAADWLTSAWDQNAGSFVTSPLASVVEDIAREWLLELFDLPRGASVGFATGCQMANFSALAAARDAVLRRAAWNVEEQGMTGAPPIQIVLGAEAHVTIYLALRMLGFGTRTFRVVETDGEGRMRPHALRRALLDVRGPCIVCA